MFEPNWFLLYPLPTAKFKHAGKIIDIKIGRNHILFQLIDFSSISDGPYVCNAHTTLFLIFDRELHRKVLGVTYYVGMDVQLFRVFFFAL